MAKKKVGKRLTETKRTGGRSSKKKTAARTGRADKMIYYFGRTRTDGNGRKKTLLGGKGANLAEMTGIGLPVPPGFTITTDICDQYYKHGKKLPKSLMAQVTKNIDLLAKELGKKFGDKDNPLLVSVRSGAAVSMPGMMNTILNLGLNDRSVTGVANATGLSVVRGVWHRRGRSE